MQCGNFVDAVVSANDVMSQEEDENDLCLPSLAPSQYADSDNSQLVPSAVGHYSTFSHRDHLFVHILQI